MAYTKQNFENGQILTAEQLNHMEQGIAAPDWNDVTNKPFYDLEPWIPPVTLPEPGAERMEILGHMIKENTKYVVNFNGTDYECESFTMTNPQFAGNVYLGNQSLIVSSFENNGSPFLLVSNANWEEKRIDVLRLVDESLTSCTISIRLADEPTIKHLDPKYLPNGVPYVVDNAEEVYPETTLTMGDEFYPVPQPFAVEIGERFIVTIDGVNYNSSVVSGDTIGGPPVPVLINDGGSFAEPAKSKFAIVFLGPVEGVIVQPFSGVPTPNPFNLTVRKINTVLRPVDLKCLPDGTPYTAEGELLYEFNYDGVSAGKVTTAFLNAQAVKISDLTPDESELIGATVVRYDMGVESQEKVVSITDANGDGGAVTLTADVRGLCAIVVYKAGAYINGTYPEPGFYVWDFEGIQYTKTIYKKETIIQPIDPRCIVLTSPNGTKFNLTVSDDGTLSATPVS